MRTAIALGSNLGDRLKNLRHARDEIARKHGELRCSRVYETEPVDCEAGAAPFLNAVVEFDYDGEPTLLLEELRDIETQIGRPLERARNAPRVIDLDILYIGALAVRTDVIALPHQRIRSRRFVLAPLCDLRPELILPGESAPVAELLARLPAKPIVEVFAEKF